MIEVDIDEDFEYVVNRKKPERICFGMTGDRKTLFDIFKFQSKCGPQTYHIHTFNKPRSKRGMAGIGNISKRTMPINHTDTPSPCKYNVISKMKPKSNFVPFNSSVKVRKGIVLKEGPGPTVYNAYKVNKCKRTEFDCNFGHPCMIQNVEMVCINYPTEKCVKCERPFEVGDHWHYHYSIYLCTFCMDEEHRLHELYTPNELKTFKKIRTCNYMHKHERTSAKIRLLTQHEINKKIRLENYLALYLKCY
ncbi:PREDICTED: uncharacterized protein LOC108567755 [Nicrophorus vespilloides]|uniref:Uncharacterized protein LOC108567755 n=1 Tax=Nicrophorus vespilloides TaxID=110193 RepID=A0ABM1NAN9_NICVS|nr:PREDICTED: uncharacterized protein LOC108567755 [Nicrophorus vespilloides]